MQQTEINGLDKVLRKEFHKEEGPFVRALDKALASFYVQRQAYYSGTFASIEHSRYNILATSASSSFVLQPANLDTLCHSVVKVAEDHCPTALKTIEKKFKNLFTLFSECHNLYDGSSISDPEIDTLGKMATLKTPTRH